MSNEELDNLLDKIVEKKLLYVEDNQEVRVQTLKMLGDFFTDIKSAKNGVEGLKLYNSYEFDIIISDVNMPIMDGIEMSTEIRKKDKYIPIIAISAHNEIEILNDIKNHNIAAYIFKPIDLDEFLEVLYKIYN